MIKNKKIHFIGIGGISMSAICKLLLKNNNVISGSDINISSITKDLESMGVIIYNTHSEDNLDDNTDIVIYSSAVSNVNPEIIKAKKLGIKLYERSEILGYITKEYCKCICICGSHGKSTTTGMLASIFITSHMNPTVLLGAECNILDKNLLIGTKEYLIMEACEYVDSFLNFNPTDIIVTNIDIDHLDYFSDLDDIKNSFKKFTNKLNYSDNLIINNDDINSLYLVNDRCITYGINTNSNVMAKNIHINGDNKLSFDLFYNNKFIFNINLNVYGIHNIYNALGAISIAFKYIDNINDIKTGIEAYTGIKRRFEYIGKYNSNLLYDDYAHHPTEIEATYNIVKQFKKRNIVIFQPHTYSRTKEFLTEFALILAKFDQVILAPIYAAREDNLDNVDIKDLYELIYKDNSNVYLASSFDDIISKLKEDNIDDNIIISMGAGDVNKVIYQIKTS